MNAKWRMAVVVFVALATPFAASAAHGGSHTSALVWNDIAMIDGGTYSVPLNAAAPSYVTGPERISDGDYAGEFVFELLGKLYQVNGPAERELVESFSGGPAFDDPDDPNDGDELFLWQSAGTYELELYTFPPPQPFFIRLREWLATMLFADIAYAQIIPEPEPIYLATIRFTIEDADTQPSAPDPVIIIPGILGSEQHNGEWIIDPILHTYDDLIATLDANGYTREVDLFTFPYNWRKSNVETALLLKEKIDDVKEVCECDKVDLVAHSMGGLVARQYIQSDAYEGDVDQLIFLGTPHLGAPKAYLMWEAGEVGPRFSVWDSALEIVLNQEARERGFSDLFNYLRSTFVEAVRELLPIYSYIFDGSQLRNYPANYPVNPFLENLEVNLGQLSNSGVEVHNIVGEVPIQKTVVGIDATNPSAYLPKWPHGYPRGFYDLFGDHGLIRGQGDETVPFNSAAHVASNLEITTSAHNALPEDSAEEVFKILTGNDASTLIDNINLPNIKIIFVKMLSPADLLIVTPDGKKIGKDLNGQEVNEILNAFYTGFNTDSEFITILNPLDGQYKIYSQGTGSGPYAVETDFISDATTTSASFTGYTAPGITSQLNVDVAGGAIAPNALDIVVTYESTLADLERIYNLGWMNVGIYKSLKAQLLKAKKSRPLVAKPLLQAILKQLKAYRGKLISEQGYQILKADIESLMNN